MIDDKIKYFIDEIVLPRANPLPGVPEHLRGDWNQGDWYSWIAIDSPVKKEDLNKIEREIKVQFPKLFSDYFLYKQILDGDYGLIRLPDMTPDDPMEGLRSEISLYSEYELFQRNSLLPFAQDGNDGGPLCFKFSEPNSKGDYPIYFVDHGCMTDPNYLGEKRWDSFEDLLDFIVKDTLSYE